MDGSLMVYYTNGNGAHILFHSPSKKKTLSLKLNQSCLFLGHVVRVIRKPWVEPEVRPGKLDKFAMALRKNLPKKNSTVPTFNSCTV